MGSGATTGGGAAAPAGSRRPPSLTRTRPPGDALAPSGARASAAAAAGRALIGGAGGGSRPPSIGASRKAGDAPRELPNVALRADGGAAANGDSLQELLEGRLASGAPRGRGRAVSCDGGGGGRRRGGGQLDFDDEARKLWARLNLDPGVINQGQYNAVDALWRHPETGAIFYVGNQTAASNLSVLNSHKITHVVNCTDTMPLYHEATGRIKYFRFDITSHYRKVRTDDDAVAFVAPVLDFVGKALAEGHNVMAHCLAGAHRAGTTGCLCLMHFAKLPVREAVPAAQRMRPIIDPIGEFPELLAKVERGWNKRRAANAGPAH